MLGKGEGDEVFPRLSWKLIKCSVMLTEWS